MYSILFSGGLFEVGEEELVKTFETAIARVNNDRTLASRVRLVPRIQTIKAHDSFHAAKTSEWPSTIDYRFIDRLISTPLVDGLIDRKRYSLLLSLNVQPLW